MRTARMGIRSASLSPSHTAGAFAIIIPSVVPSTTCTRESKRAASATVANSLVLSPHLGQKEGDKRGDEGTGAVEARIVVERVGMQGPEAEGDEEHSHADDERGSRDERGDPFAERAGERVIGERGHQDTGENRPRPA